MSKADVSQIEQDICPSKTTSHLSLKKGRPFVPMGKPFVPKSSGSKRAGHLSWKAIYPSKRASHLSLEKGRPFALEKGKRFVPQKGKPFLPVLDNVLSVLLVCEILWSCLSFKRYNYFFFKNVVCPNHLSLQKPKSFVFRWVNNFSCVNLFSYKEAICHTRQSSELSTFRKLFICFHLMDILVLSYIMWRH